MWISLFRRRLVALSVPHQAIAWTNTHLLLTKIKQSQKWNSSNEISHVVILNNMASDKHFYSRTIFIWLETFENIPMECLIFIGIDTC